MSKQQPSPDRTFFGGGLYFVYQVVFMMMCNFSFQYYYCCVLSKNARKGRYPISDPEVGERTMGSTKVRPRRTEGKEKKEETNKKV